MFVCVFVVFNANFFVPLLFIARQQASESPPAPFIAMAPVALPVPVEPVGGRGSVMSEAPRVPRPGNQSSTAAYGGARNTPIVTRVKSGAGGPGTETEEEGLEDDEDEDEGWDNGDGGGGAVVELNGTGGSGIFPAALQAIQVGCFVCLLRKFCPAGAGVSHAFMFMSLSVPSLFVRGLFRLSVRVGGRGVRHLLNLKHEFWSFPGDGGAVMEVLFLFCFVLFYFFAGCCAS